MKLVLSRLSPRTTVLDLANDLPPQDVSAAALVLAGARRFLPEPCVVCAVVDPGVGSARRILAAEFRSGVRVLAPDNGLLAAWIQDEPPRKLREVTNHKFFNPIVSAVFHGRDIFAPVAARLALGLGVERVGPKVNASELAPSPWPNVVRQGKRLNGQVVYADRFGNLVTNIHARELRPSTTFRVRYKNRTIPFVRHYAEAERGKPVALIGSFDFLELAVRDGSAARVLRAVKGANVIVEISGKAGSRGR